ncbi:hypothetical protein [uncultured Hoeflea sp.]|uniref:hypothetical protein n=1 Tax=uncultured Hoeflea sp. TaxID=538666 RepID=UPI00262D1C7F|nr:hypothetical protein [uncultured Hoeflea sp.]
MPKLDLHAFVSRGANTGELLFPHQHEDGTYVVSKTRFEADYIRMKSKPDILQWLEKGYSLRMSNPANGITAPSLITPESIYRPVIM